MAITIVWFLTLPRELAKYVPCVRLAEKPHIVSPCPGTSCSDSSLTALGFALLRLPFAGSLEQLAVWCAFVAPAACTAGVVEAVFAFGGAHSSRIRSCRCHCRCTFFRVCLRCFFDLRRICFRPPLVEPVS